MKFGSLSLLGPYGPVQASKGIALPIAFTNSYAQKIVQVLSVHTSITIISVHIYYSLFTTYLLQPTYTRECGMY